MTKILIDEATMKLVLNALEAKDGWGSSIREAKEKAITALKALASEAKEQPAPVQGWKTVPVEPTVAMIDATEAVEADMREMVVANWKGMLAAAPQPAQRKPLTDDQIRGLTPKPDGIAESDARRVEVFPGVMGTEYDEVDAWSMPLVMQIARAIEAAHGIKENT